MGINKITSIVHFNTTETDGEFILQQLYSQKIKFQNLECKFEHNLQSKTLSSKLLEIILKFGILNKDKVFLS